MIAHLKGTILRKSPGQVVLDVGGVGYGATVPLSTYFALGDVGQAAELFVHTHVTDDAITLFGFATEAEKEMFLKLVSVSGIGPKLATAVLSGLRPEELAEAVRASDVARISRVPGIGKKTALRIAMELQDKVESREKVLAARMTPEKEDLLSALLNLGFRAKEAERVVDQVLASVPAEGGFERKLRECLKRLAKL